MMNLFVGPKNCFIFQNLTNIKIVRCEKLEIIFSNSTLRSLPELCYLLVEDCRELKQIIEDQDAEDRKISKTCFPKLKTLVVISCNKLKCVFPVSLCKELPEIQILIIDRANELVEVFGGDGDRNVDIPNLMFVVFYKLPSLYQGNQFHTVRNCLVQNCPNLSLTSTMRSIKELEDYFFGKITGTLYTL